MHGGVAEPSVHVHRAAPPQDRRHLWVWVTHKPRDACLTKIRMASPLGRSADRQVDRVLRKYAQAASVTFAAVNSTAYRKL